MADFSQGSFPPAHELFLPLQADPAEPHFGVSYGTPVSQRAVAKVDIGDYLGLYRWPILGGKGAMQLNIGGAIDSRFDFTTNHDLQVIDYYGNIPLDVQIGRVSARLMFYHDSSHLGDDYLREKGIVSENHSWEALRGLVSVQPFKPLRLYGGYSDAFHTKPGWMGPQALQGGAEVYFNPEGHGHWYVYWANDLQSWHRDAWNPTWTSQLGCKSSAEGAQGRGISYYVQFMTGPRLEGQFFPNHETIWLIGLKFDISQHAPVPTPGGN